MSSQNCLNLTLENPANLPKNILDGITLYEPIDINVLDKLINSDLLKESFNNPLCEVYHSNEKQQLLKYRDMIENGRAKITYNKYLNNPYGRSNPGKGLGLFPIRRELRHTLAGDNFEDVDIDNAHPSFLEQVMTANNHKCKMLQDYISDRPKWFKLVVDHYKIKDLDSVKENPGLLKDIPKNLFIRILFSGGPKRWAQDFGISPNIKPPKQIKKFTDEIERLNKIISDANPELVQKIKEIKIKQKKMTDDGFCVDKPKQKYNINGSVSSFFLQEKEVNILSTIFIYCKEKKYINNDNCVLCADGLMIEKHLYKPQLLDELKTNVKDKTGFNLNFSNKAMEQGYIKILDNHLKFDLYTPTFTTGLIADYFKIMYSNKFLNYYGTLYTYTGVHWKAETDKKNSTLHNFVDSIFYKHLVKYISEIIANQQKKMSALKEDQEDELEALKVVLQKMTGFLNNINVHLRTVKKRKDIVDDIINKLTCNYIEFDKNPHYYVFKNKIYDLAAGDWVQPNYNQYLFLSTGWDWIEYDSPDNKTELLKIIKTIFPQKDDKVMNHYLMALSTGLYGQSIERIFIATGRGGNGKSLLNSLMMFASGEYGYKLPSNILLGPIVQGPNPAVANADSKRFCLTQEPDGNKRICSSTLKELTGDSAINARKLQSNKTETILKLSLFLECNELPKMDETTDAIVRRVDVTPFVSKFVEQATYNDLTPEEREAQNIILGNTYYKTEEFKNKYKQALITILFDHFRQYKNNGYTFDETPRECKTAAVEYLAASDDIFNWFAEFYEKEDGKESTKNVIYLSDLYDKYSTGQYFQNMTKKQKQEMNKTKFIEKIKKNIFLESYIKPRDSRYNDKKHSKEYIIRYKEIKQQEEEPDTSNALDL